MKLIVTMLLATLITIACGSNKNKKDVEVQPNQPMAEVPLSPGTAHVKVDIKEMINDGDLSYAVVNIVEVLGYGSSTEPIPSNTDANIAIPASFTEKQKSLFKTGTTLEMIISSQSQMMGMGQEKAKKMWTIEKLMEVK